MSKDKGRKWDGKSRVSNNKYRKRFDEITWKNIDEISSIINKKDEGNPNWLKGYNKWKKQGIINDEVKVGDFKKYCEKYNAKKDIEKIFGQKEKEELNDSYQQSLNNKKERQKNDG